MDELQGRGLYRDGQVIPFYPPRWAEYHPDEGFETRAVTLYG